MRSERGLRAEGVVEKAISDRLYRVALPNGHRFYGHLPLKAVRAGARFAVGDRVEAEMTPYDLTKGRITYRFK